MKLQLYKPVVSSRKDKKYMVLTKNGVIHFGARGGGGTYLSWSLGQWSQLHNVR